LDLSLCDVTLGVSDFPTIQKSVSPSQNYRTKNDYPWRRTQQNPSKHWDCGSPGNRACTEQVWSTNRFGK